MSKVKVEPTTAPVARRKGQWMYWLLGGFGCIVLLFAIPIVIGIFLPAEFEARVRTTFKQTPEAVWAAIQDYRARPLAGAMCRGVEDLKSENGLPAWREDLGQTHVRVTTETAEAPKHLVREMADEVVPMRMRCEYTLTPTATGCAVDISAKGVINRGTWHVPMFRFMIHVFGGAKSGQRQYLEALAKSFGETAKIE